MTNSAGPYPGTFNRIDGFRYDSGLLLMRLPEAVRDREGEDADYIIGADYVAHVIVDGKERELRVPRGLTTDLVSVHWSTRWLVSRVGPYLEAAILHDYLYVAWQDIEGREANEEDRRFADEVMFAAMTVAGVRWRRWAIYWAVRWLGKSAYEGRNAKRYEDVATPETIAKFPRPFTEGNSGPTPDVPMA